MHRTSAQLTSSPSESPYYGDVQMNWDHPLDAFDRELLAADLQGNQWQSDHDLQQWMNRSQRAPTQTRYRRQLGVNDWKTIPHQAVEVENRAQDAADTYPQHESSSPPHDFVSSPTVLALQNKKHSSHYFGRSRRKSALSDSQGSGRLHSPGISPQNTTKINTHSHNRLGTAPIVRGIPLVPTYELPDRIKSIFDFDLFNAVQSKCFATAFQTNDNLVLSAPTGSGKTVIMELALCRLILEEKSQDFKIVYQAPTKSLCSERYRDWNAKLNLLGLQCAELTGDVEGSDLRSVQGAHVIITTPEKWDSATRKWKDNSRLMQMIKLFLVDEVHILREVRGAVLEAIVSRMKSIGTHVRFIALSATIPNSEDVAAWLGLNPTQQDLPAHCDVFDESFRPVKLEKHVLGYPGSSNDFAFDALLVKEIPAIIARFSKGKPVMVFCATKKTAHSTAAAIAKSRSPIGSDSKGRVGQQRQSRIIDSDLSSMFNSYDTSMDDQLAYNRADTIQAGVAFHHGGLEHSDRQAVEDGFIRGYIDVICCTSTLAVGVNLPCYLVIIKGTKIWTDAGLQEYSSLDITQMLGRAGRPQYEQQACAVILTQREKVPHYQKMVSAEEVLESSLHQNLIEHLNAEVCIGTIHNVDSAKRWLASSFLNVRLGRNPQFYQLQQGGAVNNGDEILGQICERDLRLLKDAMLIQHNGGLQSTPYGAAMARYYLSYETMLTFLKLPSKPKLSEILTVVSQAHEFSNLKMRAFERATYKKINGLNEIRFPINVDLTLPCHKVSLLIQARLAGFVIDKSYTNYVSQFNQDTMTVKGHCDRLIRCIIDMQVYRGDAVAVKNALELCRSFAAGVWDSTPMQLKQVESIGEVTARKLISAGIDSIEALLGTEPSRVEVVMGKSQPFGSVLLKKAAKLPNLHVLVKKIDCKKTRNGAEVRIKCELGYLNSSLPSHFNQKPVSICFLCESSDGNLIDFRRFSARRMHKREEVCLTVTLVESYDKILCHVMCDEIVGTYRCAELRLGLDPSWFSRERRDRLILNTHGATSHKVVDHAEFDDAELADDDFLAAEFENHDVEVVEGDIEQIMASENQKFKSVNGLKRKAPLTQVEKNHRAVEGESREPKKLKNGNWTCRHTCNEMGKQCKHQCCKEGVKKPRRCEKASDPDLKTKCAVKSAPATMLTNAKGNHDKPVVDINDIYKVGLEFDEPPNDAYHRPSMEKSTRESRGNKEQMGKLEGELDTPVVGKPRHKDLSSSQAVVQISISGSADPYYSIDDEVEHISEFDYLNEDLDIEDCDWGIMAVPETDNTETRDKVDQACKTNSAAEHETLSDEGARAYADNSKDLGEDKRLFVSPSKTNQSSNHDRQSFEDITWPSDDLDFVDEMKYTGSTGPVEPVVVSDQVSLVDSGPKLVPDSEPRKDSVVDPSKTDPTETAGFVSETAEGRDRRLHEEHQRKLWSELPGWMYEEFGAYVNLV